MTNEETVKSLKTLRESINGVFDYNSRKQCTALDKAIKALEQQPSEDCISRKQALDDKGLAVFHRYDDYVKMRNYLKSLPSVTPQPKTGWIPVNERLPEEGEDVLVYVKGYDSCGHYEDELCYAPDGSIHFSGECKHGECEKCKWNLARHFYYYEVAAHFNEPTSFSSDGWLRISEEDEVIAWMPLPEPYQSND